MSLMSNREAKILVLVEGAKTDIGLMNHLFHVYEMEDKYEIVSYNTEIYTLYNSMFRGKNPADFDLLLHLKEREPCTAKKLIFNEIYAEILLIFDLDPQDQKFSPTAIRDMLNYFSESTDMGKLYINYPMIEAFYHMKSIPDTDYDMYTVRMSELQPKSKYKQRVNKENRNRDYKKFAINKHECSIVITQNISKAWHITGQAADTLIPNPLDILNAQLTKICSEEAISVLCTCAFYIAEYDPKLLEN